ncbi:MAG: zinc ribbon domain-containing protein [Thermoproteales archaeon]|nr:zinc ribbon domain-containing protein [Thermoproteales archaeon]RLE67133.1 MAG: hypothetical protein DRJ47_01055 [Thermoprotei archaeon]
MSKERIYASVLLTFRKRLVTDIFDSIVIIAVSTVFTVLAPYIIMVLIGVEYSQSYGLYLQALLTVFIIYVVSTRTSFVFWDAFKIIYITARLPSSLIQEEYKEDEDARKFELLLENEYKTIRRVLTLISLAVIVLMVATLPAFLEIMSSLEIPVFFKENPLLLVAPISLVFLILALYHLPVLGALKNDLEKYYRIVLSLKVGFEPMPPVCPVCKERVPEGAFYCPFCGAAVSRSED